MTTPRLNRRRFLKAGALGTLGLAAGAVTLAQSASTHAQSDDPPTDYVPISHDGHEGLDMPGFVGEVNHTGNGFNPTDVLTDFNWGDRVSQMADGRTLRE